MTCQIPYRFEMYGSYLISLYEKDTMYKLNDENILQILVLPRPVISTTSMTSYVTSMSDDHISRDMNSQIYVTHFKVNFDKALN
jgi:hypothetical protein